MGDIVDFSRRHERASSTSDGVAGPAIADRASKVTALTPFSEANRARLAKCVGGMPRLRQQLTDDLLSDSAEATALVPPRALMTESGVLMDANLVCTMQTCQEFASGQTTFGAGCGAIEPMRMDPPHVISARLDALRKELKIATDQAFADEIGLSKGQYSLIKNAKRNLSFETACVIKDKWGISLDWLYFGDFQQASIQIMTKIGRGTDTTSEPIRKRQRA